MTLSAVLFAVSCVGISFYRRTKPLISADRRVLFKEKTLKRASDPLERIRFWCREAKRLNFPPLILACEAGDVDGVRALLQCTHDMVKDESEDVREFMKEPVEKRVNMSRAPVYEAPIHVAVAKGHVEIGSLLIEHQADIETKNKLNRTPLLNAIEKGHTATVALLLTKKASLEFHPTPLHIAARHGQTEISSLLLDHGVDINDTKMFQSTPLHYAAVCGESALVSLFINKGADLEAKDECRRTPLKLAAERGHTKVVDLLLQQKANIEAIDEDGRTPLHSAVKRKHTKTVSLLLSHSADIDAVTESEWTALQSATPENEFALRFHRRK